MLSRPVLFDPTAPNRGKGAVGAGQGTPSRCDPAPVDHPGGAGAPCPLHALGRMNAARSLQAAP